MSTTTSAPLVGVDPAPVADLLREVGDLGREPADEEPWGQRYARRIVQHSAR